MTDIAGRCQVILGTTITRVLGPTVTLVSIAVLRPRWSHESTRLVSRNLGAVHRTPAGHRAHWRDRMRDRRERYARSVRRGADPTPQFVSPIRQEMGFECAVASVQPLLQYSCRSEFTLPSQRALPNDSHSPTGFQKKAPVPRVPVHVGLELRLPEFLTCGGGSGVLPEQWERIEHAAQGTTLTANELVVELETEALNRRNWPSTETEIRVARASLFAVSGARARPHRRRTRGRSPANPQIHFDNRRRSGCQACQNLLAPTASRTCRRISNTQGAQ